MDILLLKCKNSSVDEEQKYVISMQYGYLSVQVDKCASDPIHHSERLVRFYSQNIISYTCFI